MIVVFVCSLMALLLTYLDSKNQVKGGMKFGFILVTILGCIHYDYGNDYMSYYNLYKLITDREFDFNQIMDGYPYKEPGWQLINWAFKPIGGFFMMVAVFNIIQNCIVYRMIKRYVSKEWYVLAVFIYLFNVSYYVMAFSMMRQMFVAIVFLGIWPLIYARKWIISLALLYVCTFVHSSSVILLPFAFWGYLPIKNGKYIGPFYAVMLLALWVNQDLVNQIFNFSIENNEKLSMYSETYGKDMNQGLTLGLGFVINLIPIVLGILYLLKEDTHITTEKRSLVALAFISSLIVPFANIIQLISRLSTYFGIYTIISYPYIYSIIKSKEVRVSLLFLFIFITLYTYFQFFVSEIWIEKYAVFKTIFSQI